MAKRWKLLSFFWRDEQTSRKAFCGQIRRISFEIDLKLIKKIYLILLLAPTWPLKWPSSAPLRTWQTPHDPLWSFYGHTPWKPNGHTPHETPRSPPVLIPQDTLWTHPMGIPTPLWHPMNTPQSEMFDKDRSKQTKFTRKQKLLYCLHQFHSFLTQHFRANKFWIIYYTEVHIFGSIKYLTFLYQSHVCRSINNDK